MMSYLQKLREAVKQGDPQPALAALRRVLEHPLSTAQFLQLTQLCKKLDTSVVTMPTVKIALLGTHTMDTLADFLRVHLLARGFGADFYIAPFGTAKQQVIDEHSDLYAFNPDFIFWMETWRDVAQPIQMTEDPDKDQEDADALVDKLIAQRKQDAELIRRRSDGLILFNCVDIPDVRPRGWLDSVEASGLQRTLTRYNADFAMNFRSGSVAFIDFPTLQIRAMRQGEDWFDERLYYHSKHPFSLAAHRVVAGEIADYISINKSTGKKCLILDLDGTLWGGVLGDDGIENVRVGQGSGESEAFYHFGRYVKQLQERGVMLAICSKNERSLVEAMFEKRSGDLALRLSDFSTIIANWQDKATNVRELAKQLNIGIDSMVFFDNDAVERAWVREQFAELTVVEVPEDPALYIRALDTACVFGSAVITQEDSQRQASYRALEQAEALRSSAKDMQSFLQSLDMRVTIRPFQEIDVPRIAQLINRTNQFNLTTRRYTEADVRRFMDSDEYVTFSVRLADRFADHGLISVFIGRIGSEVFEPKTIRDASGAQFEFTNPAMLTIDTWLMSCRVFSRGVEHKLFSHLVDTAKELGIETLLGEYHPTAKNTPFGNFYAQLGFRPAGKLNGATQWRLNTADASIQEIAHIADGSYTTAA